MPNLALADLVLPYLLRGENLGPQHAALAALRAVQYETAVDELGVAIRGRCEFNGYASISPTAAGLSIEAGVDEGARAFDPNRHGPVFDLRETAVEFELFVPRARSAIIAAGDAAITAAAFEPTRTVLNEWNAGAPAGSSDYPGSGFTLDLILKAPTLRPPYMQPAKLNAQGALEPDEAKKEVALGLPKMRFRLSHGNDVQSRLRFELVSAGVSSLDDPGDIGVAELITMDPPYAYVGPAGKKAFGIGFRSATLDLSSDWTPPALLEKAQVGDDWTGLYLPEARVFVSPDGLRDFAFEAGAQELLIGVDKTGGIWGDFDAALVNQGSGELEVLVRFVTVEGRQLGIVRTGPGTATARVPAQTRMVVEAVGGRAPFARRIEIDGTVTTAPVRDVDLTAADSATVKVTVTDSSATPIVKELTVELTKVEATPTLPPPGPPIVKPGDATIKSSSGELSFELVPGAGNKVRVRTNPAEDALHWTVGNGAEGPAAASVEVEVAPGADLSVRARRPAVPGSAKPLNYYFYYDKPKASGGSPGTTDISTAKAVNKQSELRDGEHENPAEAYATRFEALPAKAKITIQGHASYEGDPAKGEHNCALAWRRAEAVRALIERTHKAKEFKVEIDPPLQAPPKASAAEVAIWAAKTQWTEHGGTNDRDWWLAVATLPAADEAERSGQLVVTRPALEAPPVPPPNRPTDPQPEQPKPPDWFRSGKVLVRLVDSQLIALQMDLEVDFNTLAEQELENTKQLPAGAKAPKGHTLEHGAPVPPGNPADGITRFRLLVQTDPATGRMLTLLSAGADPGDTDGLYQYGWAVGGNPPTEKDVGLTLLGSYFTFWPLLAAAPPVDAAQDALEGRNAAIVECALAGAALAVPGVIAALPFFRVERVTFFGGELVTNSRDEEVEANLLLDVGVDWSMNLFDIVEFLPEEPLSIRYKAIGLRFANHDDGADRLVLRPVFDSSRGYTIDLSKGRAPRIREPYGRILRVFGARLSKSNPLTLEIDIGLGVDLGVVSVDRASVRAYLDEPRPPELTALAARVDIPGALVGSGYLEIGSQQVNGQTIATIGGQLDLTIRPVGVRVAAAVEIAEIPAGAGGPATGVYVGLNVVLPVGLPLANSGLGIFGFRGIFGMHYERNATIGAGSGAPALKWLEAADGKPHLLVNPDHPDVKLWQPRIDRWSFGLGVLIGTMEGGFVLNLDGTLLLELPGPRVLIMMNARIVSPPPSVDELGGAGGVLAVIEITPEHFLIGILISWEIKRLIRIAIPVEAMFPFGANAHDWHVYLGARPDYGQQIEVEVLGIVKGTGYLMFRGDGLQPYKVRRTELPEIKGFGIGLGMGASFTWGDTGVGLYLRIGGGIDVVLGFEPFTLAGTMWVAGELRLFIVSIGADAQLDVVVAETSEDHLDLYVHGVACGHVEFLFFEVEGCVDITISSPQPAAPLPPLVDKATLQARSPALVQGSGVDRGVDVSLGDCLEAEAQPGATDPNLPAVPIDSIPIVAMTVPPVATAGLKVGGLGTAVQSAPGLLPGGFAERSGEQYRYEISDIALERIDPGGATVEPAVNGTAAPVVWWALRPHPEPSPNTQLAMLTWTPSPASKAVEKTERLGELVTDRWGRVCYPAAPEAEVLWTFQLEPLGPSPSGWELEGVAWPDPPDVVRSAPAPTRLAVRERWRSGDLGLDAERGIVPAMVIQGTVPCPDRRPLGTDVERELGIAPVARVEGPDLVVGGFGPVEADRPLGLAVAPDDPARHVLSSLTRGEPVRISVELLEKARRAARERETAAERQRLCSVKLLEAPILDDGRPALLGDEATLKRIAEELEIRGVTHGELDDVVVLETGAFASLGLLLLVPKRDIEQGFVFARALDADGNELHRERAGVERMVSAVGLPGRWTDSGGPWAGDVEDVLAYAGRNPYIAVFVELPDLPEAARVEIGTKGIAPVALESEAEVYPRYLVGAVGIVSSAEVLRREWDDQQIDHERQTLVNAVGPASSENSLLVPDSVYRIQVSWHAKRQRDGVETGSPAAPIKQSLWFRTDRTAPERLDPWMLVTLPEDRETATFGREPFRLVFNTHDVDRLYAAYGKELRMRFQAASGNHPESGEGVPHPFAINETTLVLAPPAILSPWEDAVAEMLGEVSAGTSCVAVDETRSRHGTVDVPIPLDPYMDYILDVESVDAGAAAGVRGPSVYRSHFTTGGFGTLEQFAGSLVAPRPLARASKPGAFEQIRTAFAGRQPQGSELDEALRNAGIEPLAVPDGAAVTVFWEQAASTPPQPAAVVLDATEPLRRARSYPTKVTDTTVSPSTERWVLAPRTWLTLRDRNPGVLAADGIVYAPGEQRALLVLGPGARGKRLQVDLVALAFPDLPFLPQTERANPVLDLNLTRAPWEEV